MQWTERNILQFTTCGVDILETSALHQDNFVLHFAAGTSRRRSVVIEKTTIEDAVLSKLAGGPGEVDLCGGLWATRAENVICSLQG